MKRSLYREQDYAFGQTMLALRSAIGLTQGRLAEALGVSRRSVADWEAGGKYPTAKHLKHLIALAIAHRAFHAGHELEEIRSLWKAAHQKVLLDELWLADLLSQGHVRHAESPTEPAYNSDQAMLPAEGVPLVDWEYAPAVPNFYGREQERALLTQWVVEEGCRVVGVLGLGGIGKTSLALNVASKAAVHFDAVFFRSLRNAPPLAFILDSLIRVASAAHSTLPESVGDKIALLMQLFRERRCLVVLDNLETILQPGTYAGEYRAGFDEYGLFLQRLGEIAHTSCLIMTSREKPAELGAMEGRTAPVRSFALTGLANDACRAILEDKELFGTEAEVGALATVYGGNPLALKLISEPIHEVFSGDLHLFLSTGDAFFNGVGKLLDQQFERSAPAEQMLLYCLAIERDFVSLDALQANFAGVLSQRDILLALESLRRRLLIERRGHPPAFGLQPVIMEYVTDRLVEHVLHEIIDGQPYLLRSHVLVQATAKDHVRQTQERLIATPLLERLATTQGGAARVEQLLLKLLQPWRGKPSAEQGYGPGNVVNLLRLLRGHLRDLDLTQLAIRQAYLQGVEMQDISLAGATIQESVLTETFDTITAVAISSSGDYWAATSRRGEVQIWTRRGSPSSFSLYLAWQAHADMVWGLAFSPDGRTLATGSWDGIVKLWDIASGSLLWSGRHTSYINSVTFSPDGAMLASAGNDAVVRLWDVQHGTQSQALPHSGPVPIVAWSPDGRLIATGDMEGTIRLWEMQQNGPALCVQTIAGHIRFVDGLAFSPDGNTLASASWDGTVKLWEVAAKGFPHLGNERPQRVLAGHTNALVNRAIWSPDGRTVASCGRDQTIRLWNVKQASYQATLQGHSAEVWSIAFAPDSRNLLSSSADGTLRVWDVASAQCIRVIQGYTSALHDVDWNPDGTQLVGGGMDKRVTIYSTSSEMPRLLPHNDNQVVFGVGWSPDGKWLASSAWDNAIRLWDALSGTFRQILQYLDDSGNYFYGIAWSPDGKRLASGTLKRGVLVWDVPANTQQWLGQDLQIWCRQLAWSPDGTMLAAGGEDGTLYVWNPEETRVLQRLVGHRNMIMSLAWSSDGTKVASSSSGTEGGELFVWDSRTGTRLRIFRGDPGTMNYAVAWGQERSPGEGILISGRDDGNLCWWDVQTGESVRVQKAHQGKIHALRRSRDGSRLASCGDDGAIIIWDLHSGDYLQTVRRNRAYERMDITGLTGITDAQRTSLISLGAIMHSIREPSQI